MGMSGLGKERVPDTSVRKSSTEADLYVPSGGKPLCFVGSSGINGAIGNGMAS